MTREATIKKYLIVQTEGSRQVRREVEYYSLQAVIAVGFKIENERAVQFRTPPLRRDKIVLFTAISVITIGNYI